MSWYPQSHYHSSPFGDRSQLLREHGYSQGSLRTSTGGGPPPQTLHSDLVWRYADAHDPHVAAVEHRQRLAEEAYLDDIADVCGLDESPGNERVPYTRRRLPTGVNTQNQAGLGGNMHKTGSNMQNPDGYTPKPPVQSAHQPSGLETRNSRPADSNSQPTSSAPTITQHGPPSPELPRIHALPAGTQLQATSGAPQQASVLTTAWQCPTCGNERPSHCTACGRQRSAGAGSLDNFGRVPVNIHPRSKPSSMPCHHCQPSKIGRSGAGGGSASANGSQPLHAPLSGHRPPQAPPNANSLQHAPPNGMCPLHVPLNGHRHPQVLPNGHRPPHVPSTGQHHRHELEQELSRNVDNLWGLGGAQTSHALPPASRARATRPHHEVEEELSRDLGNFDLGERRRGRAVRGRSGYGARSQGQDHWQGELQDDRVGNHGRYRGGEGWW